MVIDRGKLKREAKEILRGQVFHVFLVLFVFWLAMNVMYIVAYAQSLYQIIPRFIEVFRSFDDSYLPALGAGDSLGLNDMISLIVGMLINQASTILSFFLIPFGISLYHYIMKVARKEKLKSGPAIQMAFRDGVQHYGTYFGTVFITSLLIVLWTWLLIVPGIVKSLEYKFTYYIKSDHPRLTSEQCRSLSSRMTHGHKMELFVLWLSFIGWGLLNLLTFGLVSIYYAPYRETTYALLYDQLRDEAIEAGRITTQELEPAAYAQPTLGGAYRARPPYAAYPVPPAQSGAAARNTPQMLKRAVANAYPGLPVLKSGVPALNWQHALALIHECQKNGFFILGVDAYDPSGKSAPEHSITAPVGNTWESARQFILQKAQAFELFYEIIF